MAKFEPIKDLIPKDVGEMRAANMWEAAPTIRELAIEIQAWLGAPGEIYLEQDKFAAGRLLLLKQVLKSTPIGSARYVVDLLQSYFDKLRATAWVG